MNEWLVSLTSLDQTVLTAQQASSCSCCWMLAGRTDHVQVVKLHPWSPLRTVLISGFQGRQLAGDVSHKPSSTLPLCSTRPAVTFPDSESHCPWPIPIYTAWWTEAHMSERLAWDCCVSVEQPGTEPASPALAPSCQTRASGSHVIVNCKLKCVTVPWTLQKTKGEQHLPSHMTVTWWKWNIVSALTSLPGTVLVQSFFIKKTW